MSCNTATWRRPTTARLDFAYDCGGLDKRATGILSVNGATVGEGCIDKTMGRLARRRDGGRGMDAWSPVTDDYGPWHNDFTGKITVKRYGTFGVTRTGPRLTSGGAASPHVPRRCAP
ncbi:hypothetical protein [Streptomyces sp900116325]|uniref:Uncharacterized protein n=1 Tax=Streptomyces sp. 900116325 TaxID=3154295 RepID=A0ABV2UDB0_9ACTN